MSACLSENVVLALVTGKLPEAELRAAEAHLDGCAVCRELVSFAADDTVRAKTLTGANVTPVPRDAAAVSAPPERFGRYRLLREVGTGGMGTVYAAQDPELDRVVALKLLKPSIRSEGPSFRTRLAREAQAMARLAHPNVITVHDIGTIGDQLFIAMELVDGGTLGDWLRAAPRGWREVTDVMCAAGRGLAAAHAAGVVHRDFKPDNVLFGRDGRVRVTDFGVAQLSAAESPPATAAWRTDISLTGTGTLVGTPAYMAPEQLRGDPADGRSDIFSFCVTLWAALYGERPFPGRDLDELRDAVSSGRMRPRPEGRAIPPALHEAIARGLRAKPEDRWPSMAAAVSAIEASASPKPRRAPGRIALALVMVAVGAGVFVAWREARERSCRGAERKLAGVWDPAVKDRVRAAFLRTEKPYAPAAWQAVETQLNARTRAWTEMRTEACVATRDGEQSAAVLDLRMGCLDRRLAEVRALVGLFAAADTTVVTRAASAVGALGEVSDCADTARLSAPLPPPRDAAQRDQVNRAQEALAAAKALRNAGKSREALPLALAVVTGAVAIGYRPLEAEARVVVGDTLDDLGRRDAAIESFDAAILAATSARHDVVAIDAYTALAQQIGTDGADPERASHAARMASALLSRIGPDPAREARLLRAEGNVHNARGAFADARARFQAAVAILEKQPDSAMDLASALDGLGETNGREGRHAEALAVFQRALAIVERLHGVDHPNAGVAHLNIGTELAALGRFRESLAAGQRAVAILTASLGQDTPTVALAVQNLAVSHQLLGELEQARAAYLHALDIAERARLPGQHVGLMRMNLGETLMVLGQLAEARIQQDMALDETKRAFGTDHPAYADALIIYAELLRRENQLDASLATYRQARAVFEKALPPEHPRFGTVLAGMGVTLRSKGELAEALKTDREALAIFVKNPEGDNAAKVHHEIAEVLRARRVPREALVEDEAALAELEGLFGAGSPRTADALRGIGECHLDLGHVDDAVTVLQRAVAAAETGGSPAELDGARRALARALRSRRHP